jgi:glycosyltransferase involved in cell wall biosynthesis
MANQIDFSVTIVIPTLNEEKYIGRCLESLAQLDFSKDHMQICVVDSGSSDKTIKIASDFNVKIINVDKRTIAYSRNIGAFNSSTDLIAFLDADCLPASWWIKEAISHFSSIDVVAVGSYPSVLESESNNLQKIWANLCKKSNKEIHAVDWLPSANIIVRAETLRVVRGFNDSLITCEDVDLGYRLRKHGDILYDPNIVVYHLREPKNFKEFFKKEVWHARNSISGIISHGLAISELPSLVAPFLFGIGLMVGILGLVLLNPIFISFFFFPILIWIVFVIRGFIKTGNIFMVTLIYFIYFLARSFSNFHELLSFFWGMFKFIKRNGGPD